jgi:hypothetical protein
VTRVISTEPTRRSRHGRTASPGLARAWRQPNERGATLGTGHLGLGASVLCVVQALYGLALFASHWDVYPRTLPVLGAWALYLATIAVAIIILSTLGDRLPLWSYGIFLLLLTGVVALDFIAIWPLGNIGGYATASVSAGFGLLLVVTLRAGQELIAAASTLALAFGIAIALTTPLTPSTLPTQLSTVALAVLPSVLGVMVLRGFRRMVQLELDRVLVQSTVSAPRFAVGMLASEELARLDLDAEELLDAVATGRTALPLSPEDASVAATLATELRLHLIEGRRETWLYHAVTESELLGKAVSLTDRGSLAGLLDPTQRDGLLSGVWLIVSDSVKSKAPRTVELTIGPRPQTTERLAANRIAVPITITTTNLPRNRVDPAIWDSIGRIGRYRDSTSNGSLRLDITCVVDNPADR